MTTYAVVDLETTGTKLNGHHRIIQFSCTFVKGNRLAGAFTTLVNPEQRVDQEVLRLTHLKQRDLDNAPLFDDVAGTIYELLAGTTFVAHNIQFDYRFLSQEFERVGYPPLTLSGIDTVQLAQILFPTQPSYRLSDLTRALGITHRHPHQADSDAAVTARLFIKLQRRLRSLDRGVVQRLAALSRCLLYETGRCFTAAAHYQQHAGTRPHRNQKAVGGLILRRHPQPAALTVLEYPKTKRKKERLFKGELDYRHEQARMMNDVFRTLTQNTTALFEAPTGVGKTLGYLLPVAYAASTGAKFVISTATTTLQGQLLQEALPVVARLTEQPLPVMLLKGNSHYIDIARFARTLRQPVSEHSQLLQMKILVWLSETTTGDLDELHLTQQQDPLFAQIRHHGIDSLSTDDPFYNEDFLVRQAEEQQHVPVIITNHAYLVQHAAEFAAMDRRLIVDEAQHLPDTVLNQPAVQLDFDAIKIAADTALTLMESHESLALRDFIGENGISRAEYVALRADVRVIDHQVPEIREALLDNFTLRDDGTQLPAMTLNFGRFTGFVKGHLGPISKITKAAVRVHTGLARLRHRLNVVDQQHQFTPEEQQFLNTLFETGDALITALLPWRVFDLTYLEDLQATAMVSLQQAADNPNAHLRLVVGIASTTGYLNEQVYRFFQQVLLVGANLTLRNREQTKETYDLPSAVTFYHYKAPFDYAHQAAAFLVKDMSAVRDVGRAEYAKQLVASLAPVLRQEHRQTLILFNSLAVIEAVYAQLGVVGITSERPVMAQGVTGTVAKLKKRFVLAKNEGAILLGTGTFWEGVDLPKDQLELLIIAQLPFESPTTLLNQVRYAREQANHHNPFVTLSLPRAVQRMNQGLGRLIRTPADIGALVVLDSRIVTQRYGKAFVKAWPDSLPVKTCSVRQLTDQLASFYAQHSAK